MNACTNLQTFLAYCHEFRPVIWGYVLVAAGFLAGCDLPASPPAPGYQTALETHTCTVEQMKRVEAEHLFCHENTSYLSSYCYGTAILRNCARATGETR